MEKLEITSLVSKFTFNISRNTSIDTFDYRHYKFDFDVFLPSKGFNLQRPLVWELWQKQEFILSILKESPIPKIVLIKHTELTEKGEDGVKTYQVIDGKQRLSTYFSFIKGEFCLETGHYYTDLANSCKWIFDRFWFQADIGLSYSDAPISDKDKIAWFKQINFAGTKQDKEHMKKLLE